MKIELKSFQYPAIILFIVSFLLYVNTIGFGYNGDDDVFIAENTITMAGLHRVDEIFSDDGVMNGWLEKDKSNIEEQGFRKRYRPMAQFSFAIEIEAFGINPRLSHVINVLLFSLTVILIFWLLNLFQSEPVAWYKSFPFWAALIFAIHPIHTEVVANIKSRDEIFALLFFLVSILIALQVNKNRIRDLLVFFCFILALLSKENAITFLAVAPLIYYFVSPEKLNFKKYLVFLYPYLAAAIAFGLLSYFILKGNNQAWNKDIFSDYFYQLSTSEKYGTIFISLGKYLQLLILPWSLLCDYSVYQIPIIPIAHIFPIAILLLHLGILIWALKSLLKKSIFSFGILFYFICLSVYSNILFSTGSAVAERFLYIPSLGFCIILAYSIIWALKKDLKKYQCGFIVILFTLLFIFYGFKTVERNSEWKDSFTLLQADVKKSNRCARLNNSFAELFFDGKKEDASKKDSLIIAKTYYLKAIEIYPEYKNALNQLGTIYYYLHQFDSSAYYFHLSLLVKPDQLQVFKNITLALDSLHASQKAIFFRKKLIEINPGLPPLYFALGVDYKKAGEKDSALLYLEKAVAMNPNFTRASQELESLK